MFATSGWINTAEMTEDDAHDFAMTLWFIEDLSNEQESVSEAV